MIQKSTLHKLEKILKDDIPFLESNFISKENGQYQIFGCYSVRPNNGNFTLFKNGNIIGVFGQTRTALSWCIADKFHQSKLANEILSLENKRLTVDADLYVRTQIVKRIKDVERLEYLQIKLTHRREKLKHIKLQLDKCVSLAKYWQLKGFNNETARTGRQPTNRTNR